MSHHETYCFKANIAKYIQSKKRTSDLIKYLSELYNKVNNSESIIRLITKMISNTRNPLKQLKLLTLINSLILTNKSICLDDLSKILNKKKSQLSKNSQFHKFLEQKIIQNYIPYLYKRCIYKQNQMEHLTNEDQDHYLECYKIINLLNRGLKFHETFFTLGRYYSQKIWFLIDFNIILGTDFKELYEKLKFSLSYISLQTSEGFQLIKEIEQIHEKMDSIYLNIYHYPYLKNITGKRINTHQINMSPKSPSRKNKNSCTGATKTIFSVDSTAQRTIAQNQQGLYPSQQIQVLMELQNIVSNFEATQVTDFTEEMVISTIIEEQDSMNMDFSQNSHEKNNQLRIQVSKIITPFIIN